MLSPLPTAKEIEKFHDSLTSAGKLRFLSLHSKHCNKFISARPEGLPPPLTNIYDDSMLGASFTATLFQHLSAKPFVSGCPGAVQV